MKLKVGDAVSLIAPSGFPQNKNWLKGVDILEGWGLKVKFSQNMINPQGFHAHSDKERLKFLTQAFASSSKAVWPIRGGYGLQKIMAKFISKSIKKKLFIGFSDSTPLHLHLNTYCKWPSLHAPFVGDLAKLSQKNLLHLKQVLFGEKRELVFPSLHWVNSHKTSSRSLKSVVLGGNLTLLSSSLGCPWFKQPFKSCFLFLEDIDEEAYRIDRMLNHLFLSGYLKKVKALLFGSFSPVKQKTLEDKVLKTYPEFSQIPILTGLPCGHNSTNSPLPLNQMATLQFTKKQAHLKIKNL